MWQFVNSNFFIALVTGGVGSIAIFLYGKQKADKKKDAAKIVLLEIENAENLLETVRKDVKKGILDENLYLMPTATWDEYKYLFVRDLGRNEWDSLNSFYRNCSIYDNAVYYNNTFFEKNEEQIRSNLQRGLADFIEKDSDEKYLELQADKDLNDAEEKQRKPYKMALAFHKRYLNFGGNYPFYYSPQKPVNDAKTAIENLNSTPSQLSSGLKLRILSKYGWPLNRVLIWLQGGRK